MQSDPVLRWSPSPAARVPEVPLVPPVRYAWSRAARSAASARSIARTGRPRTVVFVSSPYPIIRRGVAALLQDARHPPDVLSVLPRSPAGRVDVVVYDVIGLVAEGPDDLERFLRTGAPVIALSRSYRPRLAAHAVARGAVTAVSETADASTLAAVVEDAAASAPTHTYRPRPAGAPGPQLDWEVAGRAVLQTSGVVLTPRQVQVVDALASGATNADIAAALHLSPNTVKTHVRTAYRALGVASRAEAASWGLRYGLGWPDQHAASGRWYA